MENLFNFILYAMGFGILFGLLINVWLLVIWFTRHSLYEIFEYFKHRNS